MSAEAGPLGPQPFPGVAAQGGHATTGLPIGSASHRALRALRRAAPSLKLGADRADEPLRLLISNHRAIHPKADLDPVRRAYQIAERAHRGQLRKSGEPYITHPLAVAELCAELGMDTTGLVAALLHDTVEDTQYTLDRLRADFSDEVAHLVDGVTKIDKVRFGAAAEAETIRKLILAAGRDPRVLVIKLADRVHNMRTLGFKSRPSQERIAKATREVLVPLAGRLGIHILKRELEDMVFAILAPEDHEQTRELVERVGPAQLRYLDEVIEETGRALRDAKFSARLVGRPRHLRSVWKQRRKALRAAGAEPDGAVPDADAEPITPMISPEFIGRPRIVVVLDGAPTDCYAALGVVHSCWRPVPGRFKDHIGVPKFNMYQSLHTTVAGPDGRPLDVMIRTEAMHRVAEYGIIALHRYGRDRSGDAAVELDWLHRVLDWEGEAAESGHFMDSLRSGLSDHEVLVFSPQGRGVSLPEGSTPVDFAYAISTRLGDRCVGTKVNGQLAPLSSSLNDGDVVDVIMSPGEYSGPSADWLDFVKSPQARIQIRRWFAEDADDDSIKSGRKAIAAALAQKGRVLTHDRPLAMLARVLELPDHQALCAAVADERLQPTEVARRLILIVDGPPEAPGA